MMTWFITVCILSDQTGYIRRQVFICRGFHYEQGIQFFSKSFFRTVLSNQSIHIMRHEPAMLPCIAFCKGIVSVNLLIKGVKRSYPGTITIPGSCKTYRRIEQLLPGLTAFHESI